jgi:ATP-dependent RNA helicase DeaD
MEEFKKLGLSSGTIKALEKKGFTTPTTIQSEVIPLLLNGDQDVIGQSQTGTGKTASFGLPIIEKISEGSRDIQALVLVPTRELAAQVTAEIDSLKGDKKLRTLAVYGGAPVRDQKDALRRGVDIVVGTPGRIMDLQRRKSLSFDHIQYAVLDEADEMLNMGFVEDIKTILENTPENKKMLLFSATMPQQILNIAKKYMKDYKFIEVAETQVFTDNIEKIYYTVNSKDKFEALRRVVDSYPDFYGIIFCNTKATVDNIIKKMSEKSYGAAAIHGDISQNQREKILQQFKNKHIKILVATDVAARGIDVNDLTHVVNFSIPQSPELYVHRIGRTGRAGKKGISILFIKPSERKGLNFLERISGCKLEKQKLPSAEDIVAHKKDQIKTIIQDIVDLDKDKKTKEEALAKKLLEKHSAEDTVAALLRYCFKNELDAKNYQHIAEVELGRGSSRSSGGGSGRSRRGGGRGRASYGKNYRGKSSGGRRR